jgi:hypothetical protein
MKRILLFFCGFYFVFIVDLFGQTTGFTPDSIWNKSIDVLVSNGYNSNGSYNSSRLNVDFDSISSSTIYGLNSSFGFYIGFIFQNVPKSSGVRIFYRISSSTYSSPVHTSLLAGTYNNISSQFVLFYLTYQGTYGGHSYYSTYIDLDSVTWDRPTNVIAYEVIVNDLGETRFYFDVDGDVDGDGDGDGFDFEISDRDVYLAGYDFACKGYVKQTLPISDSQTALRTVWYNESDVFNNMLWERLTERYTLSDSDSASDSDGSSGFPAEYADVEFIPLTPIYEDPCSPDFVPPVSDYDLPDNVIPPFLQSKFDALSMKVRDFLGVDRLIVPFVPAVGCQYVLLIPNPFEQTHFVFGQAISWEGSLNFCDLAVQFPFPIIRSMLVYIIAFSVCVCVITILRQY